MAFLKWVYGYYRIILLLLVILFVILRWLIGLLLGLLQWLIGGLIGDEAFSTFGSLLEIVVWSIVIIMISFWIFRRFKEYKDLEQDKANFTRRLMNRKKKSV